MKALIITGKFATDSEYIYALYRLQEAGYVVDVAVRNKETVLGIIGEKIEPTIDIPERGSEAARAMVGLDLLVLPGGAKAMEYLRQDQDVIHFVKYCYERGGVIGSICHAAQLLISAGLVKGRRISGYYSIKDDITNAGGTFVDAPAVVDERIITSPHYKHLGHWMRAVLEVAERNRA